mgnify:CR=1 FL=1
MATTEETERIRALLQGQATQKINPFMRGLSLLTGGLAGEFTGTNEDIRSRALAKQALMEQNIRSLDEDRAIQRQKMENTLRFKTTAAGEGLGMLPGSTEEEVLANYMEARKRKNIGTEAALTAALGRTPQGMALLANRQDPAFQSGYSAANLDILAKESEAAVQERIQTPAYRSQLIGMDPDAKIPEKATAAQIKGMIEARRYELPFRMRQESDVAGLVDMFENNPNLKAFEGYNRETIGKVAPVLAKSLINRANKEEQITTDSINKERMAKSTEEFAAILQLPADQRLLPKNVARLNYLSSDVPSYWKQSDKFLSAVGAGKPLEKDQLEQIQDYDRSLNGINRFITVLGEVSKTPGGLKKFQASNFGTIQNALKTEGSKFFANSAERELAAMLAQEYEGIVSKGRKTIFGQSLTIQEGQRSDVNFGTASDKDFFNRALQYIDRTIEDDPVTFYLNSGKAVPEGTVTSISGKKKSFKEYASNPEISRLLGVFGKNYQQQQQQQQPVLSPQEEARKQELLKKLGKTK